MCVFFCLGQIDVWIPFGSLGDPKLQPNFSRVVLSGGYTQGIYTYNSEDRLKNNGRTKMLDLVHMAHFRRSNIVVISVHIVVVPSLIGISWYVHIFLIPSATSKHISDLARFRIHLFSQIVATSHDGFPPKMQWISREGH